MIDRSGGSAKEKDRHSKFLIIDADHDDMLSVTTMIEENLKESAYVKFVGLSTELVGEKEIERISAVFRRTSADNPGTLLFNIPVEELKERRDYLYSIGDTPNETERAISQYDEYVASHNI